MLVSQRTRPRCREVRGPDPHSVAVKAKLPSRRQTDYFNLEIRRQNEVRDQLLAYTKDNKFELMKNKWVKNTDYKIMHNTVQRKVYETMEEYRMHIEERRDRLKSLLEKEEVEQIKEMESMEETTVERQAKMRERVKSLRERRENERLALVAEKRDQQFREQCEELRSLRSKITQNEVCTERMAQLILKDELNRQRKEEDDLFAELWEKDRMAKEKREEKDSQRQWKLNRQMSNVLQAQRAASEAQKIEEKRLKAEEAQLLEEQRWLMKMEDERALHEKLQKQANVRNVLDKSVRLKMKRLAQDQQEELALDMKIMDQIMQDTHDDTKEKNLRKLELQKEQQVYREYLAQQLEEEKRQEKEMDKLIEAELEKSWAKRTAQLRLEKEARNRLMKDVLDTRRLQIQEKLEGNAIKLEELARDKELLEMAVEEHKQLEKERNEKKIKQTQKYREQLLTQVDFQQRQRDAGREEERREYEAGLVAENAYQQTLREILSRPYMDQGHVHPLRKARISSPKDWLNQ
ncbi:cilia- and flagella-associated protein 53 [Pelobates fuscus]|uniref:cilia- and flagella-associated protein 53 n=1 Tax=Pelobates fuscus TaxID=191477 RepID=UPI002FE4BADE